MNYTSNDDIDTMSESLSKSSSPDDVGEEEEEKSRSQKLQDVQNLAKIVLALHTLNIGN